VACGSKTVQLGGFDDVHGAWREFLRLCLPLQRASLPSYSIGPQGALGGLFVYCYTHHDRFRNRAEGVSTARHSGNALAKIHSCPDCPGVADSDQTKEAGPLAGFSFWRARIFGRFRALPFDVALES